MRKRINYLPVIIVLALLSVVASMSGCLDVFKSQDAKDARIADLSGQVEKQGSVLDGIKERLLGLVEATSGNLTPEDQAKLAADMEKLTALWDKETGTYGPLLESLLTAKDKPTAGEALGDIGNAVSGLLPYPFNIIGMTLLGAGIGGGGMKRRGDGQLTAVVSSLNVAHDGNGGISMEKLGRAQRDSGVQGLVDKIRKNLAKAEIDNS